MEIIKKIILYCLTIGMDSAIEFPGKRCAEPELTQLPIKR